MTQRTSDILSIWLMRLLMAALLLLGSEILLWTNPLVHTLEDWLLLVPGYIALGTLILDLAARYRIRDIYDAMTLAALYGLLAALLLDPQTTLVDFPRTLATRGLGGHTLLGLEMFGLFLALTGGNKRRFLRALLGFSAWLGFYWGVWVRWTPVLTDVFSEQADLMTMFLSVGAAMGFVLLFFVAVSRRCSTLTPPDLRLSLVGWGCLLIVLIMLLMVRVAQFAVDGLSLAVILSLSVSCGAVLWFRYSDKGAALLDAHIPPKPLSKRWILFAVIIFAALTVLGYELPLIDIGGYNQLSLMEFGFAALGFGWLPLLAAVFSVRAMDRQSRTGRL